MKVVQVGILIALIAVGALLFMVWRGQQQQTAVAPVPQQAQPAETPVPTPVEASPPAGKNAAKPSPVQSRKSATVSTPVTAQTGPARPPVTQEPVSPAPQTASAPPPAPQAPARAVALDAPAPPPPPAPLRTVTVAAGTLIPVRLSETLSTERVKTGEPFTATLDKPLVVDGFVIAERGAHVEGRVVESEQAGRLKGVASLSLQLVRFNTSDGQRVDIRTDSFHKAGETSKGKDAAKVGAGAGLGAVIGAIAGGGKGAAIGAAVGGAAGAGTVAATRGAAAVLPVETRIDFRLSSPVTLTEQRK